MSSSAHPVTAMDPATFAPPAGVSRIPKGAVAVAVALTANVTGTTTDLPSLATTVTVAPSAVALPITSPGLVMATVNSPPNPNVPDAPDNCTQGWFALAVQPLGMPLNDTRTACAGVTLASVAPLLMALNRSIAGLASIDPSISMAWALATEPAVLLTRARKLAKL